MTGTSWHKGGVKLEIPFSVAGMATAMILKSNERMSIIECGDGAASYLYSLIGRKNELYEALDAVFLSHEHLDHAGGLLSLLGLLEVAGRKRELDVITPEGEDGALCASSRPVTARLTYGVRFLDSSKHRIMKRIGMEVESFQTRHRNSFPSNRCGDAIPSAGYSITTGGVRIVFSGDTGPTKILEEKCSDADLSVLESTWEKPIDCEGLHLTVKEALEYGALSKESILIHPLRDRDGTILF